MFQATQAFLLQAGLPFAKELDGELIAQTFARYASSIQGIYTHAIVLWFFLSQVLRDGKEASCQSAESAVARIISKAGKMPPTKGAARATMM